MRNIESKANHATNELGKIAPARLFRPYWSTYFDVGAGKNYRQMTPGVSNDWQEISADGSSYAIQDEGITLPIQKYLNFIGPTVTAVDDPANCTTTVTIIDTTRTIEDEGIALAYEPIINFVGDGVTATNAGGKTVVTIPGGVLSVVGGTSISVDNTDPANPIVNYTGAIFNSLTTIGTSGPSTLIGGVLNVPIYGSGQVITVVGGTSISVDSTDPENPIVNYTGAVFNSLTTVGNSGAATLIGGVLNIPIYGGGGSGDNIYTIDGTTGAGRVATITDTLQFTKGTSVATLGGGDAYLDLEVQSGTPLSLYENSGAPAVSGDNYSIGFYLNDDTITKTLGGSITVRAEAAATTGDVHMAMTLNSDLKVQPTGRVIITPNALTAPSVAQLEVRGIVGTSTNVTCLITTPGNSGSQIALWLKADGNISLMQMNALGVHTHNVSSQTSADFQMRGGTDVNAFFFNAGTDNTGFGLNNPLERVHSDNKVRADVAFNINGVDGFTGTGSYTNFTIVGGIITAAS